MRNGRGFFAINAPQPRNFGAAVLVGCVLCLTIVPFSSAHGAGRAKPYDAKVLRLSEILGAVHYLRELCGLNEGQLWREHMQALLKSEGTTALRRASLTKSFNKGYRSYSRTYNECTPSAKTAIQRFIVEGVEISEGLVKK